MDVLTRFGHGDELYTFTPVNQVSLRDNFRNVVPRVARLAGADGGRDEFGDGIAPAEIGDVAVTLWIKDDDGNVQDQLDALASMKAWGRQFLYKQSMGGGERWCHARVNSIQYNHNVSAVPHVRMQVQINFQVADPFWYDLGTYSATWGDGWEWADGTAWSGAPVEQTVTGTDNTFSHTPTAGGNDIIRPRIALEVPATKSATDIKLQRVINGVVFDELSYEGTLTAGDILAVDCRALAVRLNGADAYGSAFDFVSPEWFRLKSWGSNSIRVRMRDATDQITVRMKYLGVYNT